jgi:RHH-type proline utilization regulon transcriptional repressor/proline dehydrogenase/delta 1-pyrroline-5-carboxylate dehydrogenase
MVLAEALLRVPDAATADRLIEDKLAPATGPITRSNRRAAGVGLGLGARHLGAHHPAGRDAGEHHRELWQAARPAGGAHRDAAGDAACLGSHFVLGQSIEEALGARAPSRVRYSYDMLGEGARTEDDAAALFSQLRAAHRRRSALTAGNARLPERPGHFGQALGAASALRGDLAPRVLAELTPRVLELARKAKAHDLNFHRRCRGGRPARTLARPDRRGAARILACGWEGFGPCGQAYQKRALR